MDPITISVGGGAGWLTVAVAALTSAATIAGVLISQRGLRKQKRAEWEREDKLAAKKIKRESYEQLSRAVDGMLVMHSLQSAAEKVGGASEERANDIQRRAVEAGELLGGAQQSIRLWGSPKAVTAAEALGTVALRRAEYASTQDWALALHQGRMRFFAAVLEDLEMPASDVHDLTNWKPA